MEDREGECRAPRERVDVIGVYRAGVWTVGAGELHLGRLMERPGNLPKSPAA